MIDLGERQLALIAQSREFLLSRAQGGTDVAITPECYLNGWATGPGNARLHQLAHERGGALKLAVARVNDALRRGVQVGYEVTGGAAHLRGCRRLVVSWSCASDFCDDGSYHDRYFRVSSRDTPATLWFLVATDQIVPQRLDSNVVVFREIRGSKSTAPFRLARAAARALGRAPQSAEGSVPAISAIVTLADQVAQAVVAQLEGRTLLSVLLPYEAQPFQHAIFRAVKQQDRTIRTVGYLHSALPPLPTDLIHRSGAPDLLLVHGYGQQDILARHLGWSSSALRTIKSLRYRAADQRPLAGFVFLPYCFRDAHVIEAALRDFLRAAAPGSLPRLTVRNHPFMQSSKAHAQLRRGLEDVMRAYVDRFSLDATQHPPVSIFIGATAAILEALERGVTALHICSQPLVESHSAQLWQGLKVERLGEHLFRYELRVRGAYIDFGPETKAFAAETEAISLCLGLTAEDAMREDAHETCQTLRRPA
jgi:hypothetical protein